MLFKEKYNREEFIKFLNDFLPDDFVYREEDVPLQQQNNKKIKKGFRLGKSPSLEIEVFELEHDSINDPRITLSKEAFKLMASYDAQRALVVFKSNGSDNWRLSLTTIDLELSDKGSLQKKYSNPKRFSYFLGPNSKTNTPTKFLITNGRVSAFDKLKERFSIEVVNKEFYTEVSKYFRELSSNLIELPDKQMGSKENQEFVVRLIGRTIFCWFLREKKSDTGLTLVPVDLLSLSAVEKNHDYYHKILEPIFFEVLNKPIKSRINDFAKEPFSSVPYLNGGLFSPQDDDYYKRNNSDFQSLYHNTLVIPDNWFKDFFEILETYNFTIDENTSYDEELSIDPEMLGRIFENLLAEINPETGESARKNTGSYYTPRAIVNYMVDESLLSYLIQQTGITEEKLRAIVSYDLNDDLISPISVEEREKIIDALEKVKILDPACGSGAFPIGALQKIVFILQQTDPDGRLWFKKQIKKTSPEIRRLIEREFNNKNLDYIRKLGIIRENIYGIDIQPIASEISRLRCFLTLIVEQKIQDNMENRGIEPLPNLDFKFVTANSLISLPKPQKLKDNSSEQTGMFDDNKKIDELKQIRNEYLTSSGIEREQLKSQFSKIQKDLIFQLIQEHGFVSLFKAELTHRLTEWDPFSHKASSWFDSEWMFGIKDGFDIVIGNPPYVQIQKFSGQQIQKDLESQDYETFAKTSDLYCIFYERGIQLLNQNGILTFITSNKWMRAGYGEKMRIFFLKYNPILLIDLGPNIFESATVDTNILLIKKEANKNKIPAITITDKWKQTGSLDKHIQDNLVILQNLTNSPWSIGNESEQELKWKIEKNGKILKNWDVKIYRGILTGLTEAFIIDKTKRDMFISEDPKNVEIIKPILRGRDIERYQYQFADMYLLMTGFDVDIPKLYPVIFKYLEQFEEKARKRDDQGKNWYNLRSCAYYEEFEKEKIVWSDIATEPTFSILPKGYYFNNTAYMISGSIYLKYLSAILNSKVIKWLFPLVATDLGENGSRYFKQFVEMLPIPNIDKAEHEMFLKRIESLVDQIVKAKKIDPKVNAKNLESQIDELVYKLYDLTPEEIKIVEGGESK